MSDPWAKFTDMKAFPTSAPADDPWARFAQKPVSAQEDVAKSYPTGVVQGSAGMIGGPGDVVSLLTRLPTMAAKKLEEHRALPAGAAKSLESYIAAHPPGAGLLGTIHDMGGAVIAKALKSAGTDPAQADATARSLPGGANMLPTTSDVEGALGAKDNYHIPQTVWGEYAKTLGQFTPAALFPAGVAQRAENVVVPALASETAGQVTKGTKAEPYARIAGALAGGAGVALANQPRPSVRMLAEASRGATDQQIAAATALREQAAGRGINLTLPEAMQQVTDNGTGLGRLQRVLESTRSGSDQTIPYMAQRPQQVQGAVHQFADTIAPATHQPSMIGSRAQETANTALSGVRQGINEQASPAYEALRGQALPAEAYQPLAADPAYAHALEQVRGHPVLGAPLAALPDENLHVVNEVVKHLDTLAENARPSPVNPGGNNQLAAAFGTAADRARGVASDLSPEWTLARDTVAEGRAANLQPLQQGPLGAIASTDQVPAQTRALFPSAPLEGAPAETAQALQMLGGAAGEAGPSLVRQHLVNTLNETGQNLQSGPNQWGGAKFAATIAGNPEQAQTLRAGVGAAGGDTTELDALLQALQATGKRQAPGSQTAYNMEDLKNLGSTGAAGEVLQTGLNPPGTFRRIGDAFQRFQVERNAGALAEAILSDPATAEQFLLRARGAAPQGALVHQLERVLATGAQGRQQEQLPAPGR